MSRPDRKFRVYDFGPDYTIRNNVCMSENPPSNGVSLIRGSNPIGPNATFFSFPKEKNVDEKEKR